MDMKGSKIFFEVIDFERDPDKITRYFPEIVNTLEPHRTFIFLIVFPPEEDLIE